MTVDSIDFSGINPLTREMNRTTPVFGNRKGLADSFDHPEDIGTNNIFTSSRPHPLSHTNEKKNIGKLRVNGKENSLILQLGALKEAFRRTISHDLIQCRLIENQ